MSPSVRALGLLNRLFDKFVMLLALLLVFFAAFNIWDNNQLYVAVDTVQAALMSLKPSTTQGTETGGIIDYSNENDLFGQLKAINPDIRAWLTVDGTRLIARYYRERITSIISTATPMATSPLRAACSWTTAATRTWKGTTC